MASPTTSEDPQYTCRTPLNLYSSPELAELATQAQEGRQLRILSPPGARPPKGRERGGAGSPQGAIEVLLCEDDYPGWIAAADQRQLQLANQPYQTVHASRQQISERLPQVIGFAKAALARPNTYLWGGTLGPDYDCSGLMQAAFASVGVWLPRDAYQQSAFTQAIAIETLQRGDLIFFSAEGAERISHVALSLGGDRYLHSSGKRGRNGIAIDLLSAAGDAVSQAYYRQLRGAGRVTQSYRPQGVPFQC